MLPQEVKYEFECCFTAKTDEKSRRFERDNNEFLSIKIYVQISFFLLSFIFTERKYWIKFRKHPVLQLNLLTFDLYC